MLLVDTNIIIDVLRDDPKWGFWSEQQLVRWIETDELAINPVIYSELAVGFLTAGSLEKALRPWPFVRLPLPYDASFRAAQAFRKHRERGGTRQTTLPDFFIGAHAETAGLKLLTRDTSRYATYFPKVRMIHPAD